jgi:DNA-binding MarR family transcriptional regulator
MSRPRTDPNQVDALVGTAALTSRWAERLLAAHDPPLSLGQFLALRAIARTSQSAVDLARRTGVSGPAVSQLVASLEQSGWIVRSRAADDRRRHELEPTAEGRRVLGLVSRLLSERIGPLLGALPHPEQDALTRLLPKLEAALDGSPPPRRPPPPPRPHKH